MNGKRHAPEQIIHKLRQAEVELGQGATVPQACKKIGVTEQTYYRWRNEYGGLRLDQAKRMKALETENARLKKLVALAWFVASLVLNAVWGRLTQLVEGAFAQRCRFPAPTTVSQATLLWAPGWAMVRYGRRLLVSLYRVTGFLYLLPAMRSEGQEPRAHREKPSTHFPCRRWDHGSVPRRRCAPRHHPRSWVSHRRVL